MDSPNDFKPYIAPGQKVAEFTIKSVLFGAIFGVIFGCSTVYLALKAGLTVSASIPIAVIAITLGRYLLKTTILENNIIQTAGSAGESIAAGVVFTLPGFLFLSPGADGVSVGEGYFNYLTILILAAFGGLLGTLMMIPLRRSLIVKEHGTLPYPEGTACASVLQAGEKGGVFAKTAFIGMGVALVYAILQKVLHVIAETPAYVTEKVNKFWPSATINGEITPEYLGVGYIIGPRIGGVLVAGSVLAWWALIPLLATLIDPVVVAAQLTKLNIKLTKFGWNEETLLFSNYPAALYNAYIKQIGAGAVAAGGFITLVKTIPTIVNSFRDSIKSLSEKSDISIQRTDRDLSFRVVIFGSLGLIALMFVLPGIPGEGFFQTLLIGVLVIVFGFFFVTVASRIVGLIGSSNSPISGMTIATLMGTCLIFTGVGWSGSYYEPMALVVGGMICIAAANAGATSQDLKTGYIVGATPRYQQLALFVGVIVSALAIGYVVLLLDTPTQDMRKLGVEHAIGDVYSAPQATLMATLARGILSYNLDWQFVMVGVFIAVMIELCGIKALAFAIGLYLPLSTTLPIAIGGGIKGFVDWRAARRNEKKEEDDLGRGSLFATGLIAGGAVAGVIVAILSVNDRIFEGLKKISLEEPLSQLFGHGGYALIGVLFFAAMATMLFVQATKKD
mgnify:FL=1